MSRVETARRLRKTMTPQEVRLWCELRLLKGQSLHFRRQVPIGRFIVDFACRARGVVIELDGGQHAGDEHARADRQRDIELNELGYVVLRFWNREIDNDIGAAVDHIVATSLGRLPTRHGASARRLLHEEDEKALS